MFRTGAFFSFRTVLFFTPALAISIKLQYITRILFLYENQKEAVSVFKKIGKKISSLVKGIRHVFGQENIPAGGNESSGRKGRNGKDKRKAQKSAESGASSRFREQRRHDSRKTDSHATPSDKKHSKSRKRNTVGQDGHVEKVRQKKKNTVGKIIPPMPDLIPVPEEEGKLRFCDLDMEKEIMAAAQDLGFKYCTEIQAKCLPYAIAGNDLAAKAQTGTGKTAAFLASTMTRLLRKPLTERKEGSCRVLVLAPTRELAIQIQKDAENLGKYTNLNNVVIFGGMDHKAQQDTLTSAPVDILAGTPGRIIDYSRSGALDLSRVEILVIDEADRMLDMGFIPDVRRIVAQLPPAGKRQTMLFSATLEPSVLRLVDSWLKNPVSVESEPEHMVTELIEQRFYAVTSDKKLAMLLSVIKAENPKRMLVFGNRKDHNRTLVNKLYSYGVDAELLSGDVAQEKRLKILEKFRTGELNVLVATDVAARGIHVDGVTHVVNYDLPVQPDDYVHRIGRTGRAGAKGISISFVCEYGAYVLPELEQYTKAEIRTEQPDDSLLILPEKIRREPVQEKKKNSRPSSRRSRRY